MIKQLIVFAIFFTNIALAGAPNLECRFSAFTADGSAAIDEVVAYTLSPDTGLSGHFEPYGIEIAVLQNAFTIAVYIAGEPISGMQIPMINSVNLPLGGSLFGVNMVFHEVVNGFISMSYECKKVW